MSDLRSDLAYLRQVATRALDGAPPAENYFAAVNGRHAVCGAFTGADYVAAVPGTAVGDLARLLSQCGMGELPFARCILVVTAEQISIFEIDDDGRLTDAYPTSLFFPPAGQAGDPAANLELLRKVYATGHRVHCPGCGRHLPRLRHVAVMGGVLLDDDIRMYAVCHKCYPRMAKLAEEIDRRVVADPVKYVLPVDEAQGRVKGKGRKH